MMDATETATLTVPARREAFAALSAWLEARLAPLDPPPKARRQLLVAADEILTNVASYAYPPDAPGELQVSSASPSPIAASLMTPFPPRRPTSPAPSPNAPPAGLGSSSSAKRWTPWPIAATATATCSPSPNA